MEGTEEGECMGVRVHGRESGRDGRMGVHEVKSGMESGRQGGRESGRECGRDRGERENAWE